MLHSFWLYETYWNCCFVNWNRNICLKLWRKRGTRNFYFFILSFLIFSCLFHSSTIYFYFCIYGLVSYTSQNVIIFTSTKLTYHALFLHDWLLSGLFTFRIQRRKAIKPKGVYFNRFFLLTHQALIYLIHNLLLNLFPSIIKNKFSAISVFSIQSYFNLIFLNVNYIQIDTNTQFWILVKLLKAFFFSWQNLKIHPHFTSNIKQI